MKCNGCFDLFGDCACVARVFGEKTILDNILRRSASAEADIRNSLTKNGILASHERFRFYREIRDWSRAGAESYGAVFSIHFNVPMISMNGNPGVRTIYAKAICTGCGPDAMKQNVATRAKRIALLKKWGIPTPHLYGFDEGVLYSEFIPGAPVQEFMSSLGVNNDEWTAVLGQVFAIAATLDLHQAPVVDIISDLRVSSRSGKVFYVGSGNDLGDISNDCHGLNQRRAMNLCGRFVAELTMSDGQDVRKAVA